MRYRYREQYAGREMTNSRLPVVALFSHPGRRARVSSLRDNGAGGFRGGPGGAKLM